MVSRRTVLSGGLVASAAAALAACSPSDSGSSAKKGSGSDAGALKFRIWDSTAKAAYEESLKKFTEESGIKVEVEVVP